MLLLGLLLLARACHVAISAGLKIALHAQVSPAAGFVVGSAITTAGMRAALMANGFEGFEVERCDIFYPFHYDGLHDHRWDIVIIEGWFEMINAFIHEVRAASLPTRTRVLFFCLDPSLPGLPYIAALDVDAFLTNSAAVRTELSAYAPAALIPLAVDPDSFHFVPEPPSLGARVVYVGAAGALAHKRELASTLREVAPFGLDIYGSGWSDYPEFSAHWRGVLPQEQLGEVYGAALAVVGITMDDQRASGMVNNRVFEALAAGAPLLTDSFPELETALGDAAFYLRSSGDAVKHLTELLGQPAEKLRADRLRRRFLVEANHTWHARMDAVLSFVSALPATVRGKAGKCDRSGCLAIAIVADPGLRNDPIFATTLQPALDLELAGRYRTEWIHLCSRSKRRKQANLPSLRGFDAVWAVGRVHGAADSYVRRALAGDRRLRPRKTVATRALVLWDWDGQPSDAIRRVSWYDVVFYRTEWERGRLELALGARPDKPLPVHLVWAWGMGNGVSGGAATDLQSKTAAAAAANVEGLAAAAARMDLCVIGWDRDIMAMAARANALVGSAVRIALLVLVAGGGVSGGELNGSSADCGQAQASESLQSVLETTGFGDVALEDLPTQIPITLIDSGAARAPHPATLVLLRSAADLAAATETIGAVKRVIVVTEPIDSNHGDKYGDASAARESNDEAWRSNAAGKLCYSAAGLQEWAMLFAASAGHAAAEGDDWGALSERTKEVASYELHDWHWSRYGAALAHGMTRVFCLGTSDAEIDVLSPPDGEIVIFAPPVRIPLDVRVSNFRPGRDGQWCVVVEGVTLVCPQRWDVRAVLQVLDSSNGAVAAKVWQAKAPTTRETNSGAAETEHGAERRDGQGLPDLLRPYLEISVHVELRSNMYANVLRSSEPKRLYIALGGGGGQAASSTDDSLSNADVQEALAMGTPTALAEVDLARFYDVNKVVYR